MVPRALEGAGSSKPRGFQASVTTARHALKAIWRTEGALGLWRGNGTNVMRVIPQASLNFVFFNLWGPAFGDSKRRQPSAGRFFRRLATGVCSGASTLVLLYPLELARTQISADVTLTGGRRSIAGIADCWAQNLRAGGPAALYRGLTPSLLGLPPLLGVSYASYDAFRSLVPQDERARRQWWFPLSRLAVGLSAAVAGASLTYPLDTLRRRLELERSPVLPKAIDLSVTSDGGPGAKPARRLAWRPRWARVLGHVVREEGALSLYRGFWVNVLKLAPAASAQFVLYDVLRSALTDTIQVPSGR